MKPVTILLLKIEDKARRFFEQFPFIHAFLAGVGVILFWRGVWEVADIVGISPWESIIYGILLLGAIGLFIHTFVGNAIIIKSVEKEKRIEEKTKADVEQVQTQVTAEEVTLTHVIDRLTAIEKKLDKLQ